MTTRRLIASVTVSACALLFVAVVAVRSFPLEARTPPQEARGHEPSTDPIQILAGGDHLLHGALPEYPRRAFEQRIEGDVVLDLSVDDRGEVSDARVVSGPEELRRASLESVLQWHYSPEALRSSATQVALRFRIPAEGKWFAENGRAHVFNKMAVAWAVEKREEEEPSPAGRTERQMVELQEAMQDPNATDSQKEEYKLKFAEAKKRLERIRAGVAEEKAVPSSDGSLRLSRIRTERVPRETASEIANQAGISIGDPITEATAKRIREIAKSIDEHLRVSFDRDHAGIVLTIIAP